jgi:hypothetical protein
MKLPQRIIDAVAHKAKLEYDMSYPFIKTKRDFFRENYKLLLNQ